MGSEVQRGPKVQCPTGRIGAMIEKELHEINVASAGSPVKFWRATGINFVEVSASFDKDGDYCEKLAN